VKRTGKALYHTALSGGVTYKGHQQHYFQKDGSTAFVCDLLSIDTLPLEFSRCDILYSELPFEAGFKIFESRVGHSGDRSYKNLCIKIDVLLAKSATPAILICGKKTLKFLSSRVTERPSSINGGKAMLAFYGEPFEWLNGSAESVVEQLAIRYNCLGDFMCGYGRTARVAIDHGKRFVLSDYNPYCIGYIEKELGGAG